MRDELQHLLESGRDGRPENRDASSNDAGDIRADALATFADERLADPQEKLLIAAPADPEELGFELDDPVDVGRAGTTTRRPRRTPGRWKRRPREDLPRHEADRTVEREGGLVEGVLDQTDGADSGLVREATDLPHELVTR